MGHQFSFEERIGYLLGIISIMVPFSVIVMRDFPYTGLSLSFLALSSVVFLIHRRKTTFVTCLFAATCASSLFLFVRANISLAMLNIITIIYINSVGILVSRNQPLSFISVALAPVTLILSSLSIQTPKFPVHLSRFHAIPHRLVTSIVITAGLLILIIPLLSSANPLFEHLVRQTISSIHLEKLFAWTGSLFDVINIVRYIIAGILFIMLPRIATYAVQEAPGTSWFSFIKNHTLPLFMPKVAVSIVLFIFFITQFQLYFSSAETLMAMGYTQSQYAREVFAQLSVVALIIFGLIYNDKQNKGASKTTTLILIIEALFLTGMAYKSDYDYSSLWGFTHKRLYGFAVASWILGLVILFFNAYVKNSTGAFVKQGIAYTIAIILAINIANFDYLIYHYRPATLPNGVDHEYLSRYLSADAVSYDTEFQELVNRIRPQVPKNREESLELQHDLDNASTLAYHMSYSNNKYAGGFDIRTFNLSEYQMYLRVKNMSFEEYYTLNNEKRSLLWSPIVEEEFRHITPTELFVDSPESYNLR